MSPSIHQAPLIRSIADLVNAKVIVVTSADLPKERSRLGWQRPNFQPASLVVAPNPKERRELEQQYCSVNSVHVFSGFHADPETYCTMKRVSKSSVVRIGVFVEPRRSNDGIKHLLRRIRYFVHALRWSRRLEFILATGALGERWYRECGFPVAKLYPFGYFLERQETHIGKVDMGLVQVFGK